MKAIILNVAGFNVVWTALVLGAAHGLALLGLLAYLGFASWQLSISPVRHRDIVLTLLVAPLGWLVDSVYVAAGLMQFAQPWPGAPLAPWWIAVLWANFVLLVNHGLAPFRQRQILVACLGLLGGPMAYLGADQLGAVTLDPHRVAALLVLAAVWAAAVPLLFQLDKLLQRTRLNGN